MSESTPAPPTKPTTPVQQLPPETPSRGGARRVARILVNVVVLGLLALVISSLTNLADRDADGSSTTCRPPDLDAAAREVVAAHEVLVRTRSEAAMSVRRARAQVRRSGGTPRARRSLRAARRTQARARSVLLRSSSTRASATGPTPISFVMGSDPDPGLRSFAFTTTRAVTGPMLVGVQMGQLVPAEGGREIDARDVVAWARLDPGGRSGRVFACIPVGARDLIATGRFQGSLAFDDPRLAQSTVPLVMTLSWSHTARVLRVGLLVCLIASFYVYFLRSDQHPEQRPGEPVLSHSDETLRWPFGYWVGYWRFLTSAIGGVTMIAGLISAGGAFGAQYLASDVWTPSLSTWTTFVGAVGTAFVAGSTAGRLAQNTYERGIRRDKSSLDPG